jgi:hypothetical protein
MFRRRTLFVIGAGASKEAHVPIGPELANMIAGKLSVLKDDVMGGIKGFRDPELYTPLLRSHCAGIAEYAQAAQLISQGVRLSSSIDDFLNVHSKNARILELGKAAIVRSILEAELGSLLYVDPSNIYNKMRFENLEKTWFVKLMRVMGSGIDPSNVKQALEKTSFIIFNYDRCVEQFLTFALQSLYGLRGEQAADALSGATIIHPYGTVGDFPGIPFGENKHNRADYFGLASRIKTYTERLTETDTLERMKDEVAKAQCIVFLGFSFLEQNMALLKPPKMIDRKYIFATGYGMSDSGCNVVKEELLSFFNGAHRDIARRADMVQVNNKLKCADLFDHYARSLNAP